MFLKDTAALKVFFILKSIYFLNCLIGYFSVLISHCLGFAFLKFGIRFVYVGNLCDFHDLTSGTVDMDP